MRGSIARQSDYDPEITLELFHGQDSGDVYVCICHKGIPVRSAGAEAQLILAGAGGGCRSPKTRLALVRLIEAMQADEAVHPTISGSRDS